MVRTAIRRHSFEGSIRRDMRRNIHPPLAYGSGKKRHLQHQDLKRPIAAFEKLSNPNLLCLIVEPQDIDAGGEHVEVNAGSNLRSSKLANSFAVDTEYLGG